MTEHRDGAALLDLEHMGLAVHPAGGTHDHLGKEHRAEATVLIAPNHDRQPSISVLIGEQSANRLLPLELHQAESLVEELGGKSRLHQSPHMEQMLSHLLVRFSEIYGQLELNRLVATPLVLSEGGYCIDGALLQYTHEPPHHGTDFQFRQGRDHVVEWPRHVSR